MPEKGPSAPAVCPVCHKKELKPLFRCTDHFVSGESFPLLRCHSCGFTLTGSPPSEENAGRFYQSEAYISHSNTSRGLVNQAYHLVRVLMLRRKQKIVEKSAGIDGGSLLDIGAGTGFFLRFMKGKGWRVTGTEKSDTARAYAHAQWNLPLLSDDVLFTLPAKSFDVITLWHVMEHLYHLPDYWKVIHTLLRPGGCLVIALPNPGSYDAGHYGKFWAAWDVPRHLWHFTPANLEQMATKERFKLDKIHPMPFDAFYVSILSEKYRKSKLPLLRGMFYGIISWMVSLFNPKRCSSIIYILKPQ